MRVANRFPSWKTALLILAFWTALAASFTASNVLSALSEDMPVIWWRPLAWNLLHFYLWMLLTPLVARLARRVTPGWGRFVALHGPASVLVAVTQVCVLLVLYWVICGPPSTRPDMAFLTYVRMQFAYNVHLSWITYWVVLVVCRAIDSHRRLRDERLRNAQLETQLVQSQLQTLRVQLQPHFLFNTLNAISALALADPMQARLMIAKLSDFLRLTLEERHAQQVPLARELELLRCYLDIQQVRFQDRLTTHLDAAVDTLQASVPNMILQPLVENALQHGLLAKPTRGALHIVTRREGDALYLRVDDDGLGLPAQGARDGLGLSNTRARLAALFGVNASLELQPRDDGGTRVEVRFPFQAFAS